MYHVCLPDFLVFNTITGIFFGSVAKAFAEAEALCLSGDLLAVIKVLRNFNPLIEVRYPSKVLLPLWNCTW